MYSSDRNELPPWENRELMAVPYKPTDVTPARSHQRQDSKQSLHETPENPMAASNKARLKSLFKRSPTQRTTPSPPPTYIPYGTPIDSRRQGSVDRSYHSTSLSTASIPDSEGSTTSSGQTQQHATALSGTIPSGSKESHSKRGKHAISTTETAVPGRSEIAARGFKDIFRSTSSAKKLVVECERLHNKHWAEDDY